MAEMETIYSNEASGLTIKECLNSLIVIASQDLNTTFSSFFKQFGGELIETQTTPIQIYTWKFEKGHTTSAFFKQITGVDIESLFKLKDEPKPIVVGGMSFPPLPGSTSRHTLPPPAPISGFTLPHAGTLPTPQGTLPIPQGITLTPDFIPRHIGGSEELGYYVYDYSEKAIAVFLTKSTYSQGKQIFEGVGGKQTSLYPDGRNSMSRHGWIFAKSNEDSMAYISQMLGTDIKSHADFSKVGFKSGRRGVQQKQQVPAAAYTPSAQQQVVVGPFTSGITLPTENSIFKNVKELEISLSSLKNLTSFSEKILNEEHWYYAGPTSEVNEALESKGGVVEMRIDTKTHSIAHISIKSELSSGTSTPQRTL